MLVSVDTSFWFWVKTCYRNKIWKSGCTFRKGYDSDNKNEEDIEEIIDAALELAYEVANDLEVEQNIPEDLH